jgi:hypothetical protein
VLRSSASGRQGRRAGCGNVSDAVGINGSRASWLLLARKFEFAPYEPLRRDILELGRASIDREHRTPEVLTLLWRGVAQYANDMGLRYLVECSSLNSQEPAEGWLMYREREKYRVSPEFETVPTFAFVCPEDRSESSN